MFGILYGLITLFGVTGHNVKENYYAEQRKQKALLNNNDIYTDAKGKTRYIKNNRWVQIVQRNGHKVLEDCLNGHIYIDYTKIAESSRDNSEYNKAVRNGKSVYLSVQNNGNSYWKGNRYRDIETNAIYVKRKCLINVIHNDWCELYVDIDSGMYIRKTDEQIQKDKYWYSKIDNLKNEVTEYISNRYKGYNNNKLKELIHKEYNRRLKVINSRFINDNYIDEYISKLNKKQEIYKANNDDMYYGVPV